MLSLLISFVFRASTQDPQAVLDASLAKIKAAQTATGAVTFPPTADGTPPTRLQFKFAKPNRFVLLTGAQETYNDGKNQYRIDTSTHEYDVFPVMPNTTPRFSWGFEPMFPLADGSYTVDHPVDGTFSGKPAVIAEFHSPALRTTVHIAFDPQTDLPLGFTLGEADKAKDFVYSDIHVNEPIPDSTFAWQPTAEWQKRIPLDQKLIKVGMKAPDFTISTPTGQKVTLSKALEGKKGLLLNFWFVGCNPCRQEFPHLQAMYPGLRDQNFAYLSVNNFDQPEEVTKFVKEFGYTFPIAMNGKDDADIVKTLGIPAYPTNLIIAPDRTVVARFVGYDEEGLKGAIKKLGVDPK